MASQRRIFIIFVFTLLLIWMIFFFNARFCSSDSIFTQKNIRQKYIRFLDLHMKDIRFFVSFSVES